MMLKPAQSLIAPAVWPPAATHSGTLLPLLYQTRAFQKHAFNTSPARPRLLKLVKVGNSCNFSTETRLRSLVRRMIPVERVRQASAHQNPQLPESRDIYKNHDEGDSKRPQFRYLFSDYIQRPDMDFGDQRYHRTEYEETDDFDEHSDAVDMSGPRSGPPRPSQDSTITIAEKQAFDQIFRSIRRRTANEHAEAGTESYGSSQSAVPDGRADSLLGIMNGAVGDTVEDQEHRFTIRPKRKTPSFQGPGQMEDAVTSYPTILQPAAAKALTAIAKKADLHTDEVKSSSAERLEKLRLPERQRVEALMRGAKTDFQLWNVLEAEVFPMIRKLGLGDSLTSKVKLPQNIAMEAARLEEISRAEFDTDPNMDINIHGPLYPAFLLLALRLFNRSFSKPSPLVQSILPRIKSLGIMSQALGASTALYNELLRIAWQRYDDLPTVLKLLEEMDAAGLDFNADTRDIIDEMMVVQVKAKRNEVGIALRNLYSMPTFKTGKSLRLWKHKCQVMIDERAKEFQQDLEWDAAGNADTA